MEIPERVIDTRTTRELDDSFPFGEHTLTRHVGFLPVLGLAVDADRNVRDGSRCIRR